MNKNHAQLADSGSSSEQINNQKHIFENGEFDIDNSKDDDNNDGCMEVFN